MAISAVVCGFRNDSNILQKLTIFPHNIRHRTYAFKKYFSSDENVIKQPKWELSKMFGLCSLNYLTNWL